MLSLWQTVWKFLKLLKIRVTILWCWKERMCLPLQEMQEMWGFDPWVEKIPCRRKWNPAQYLGIENPMDRRAWQAIVHRVARIGLY